MTKMETFQVLSQDRCNDAWVYNADDNHTLTTSLAASRYADKAQGLSLNQRLQQLEFSDDEDENEDGTLVSILTKAPTLTVAPPPSQDDAGAITIDTCLSF